MPVYQVEDPETGQVLELEGDSPPTEAELEEVFATVNPSLARQAKDFVGDIVDPPAEDLPELDFTFQNMEPTEALKHVIGAGDKEATLGQDKYGNTVINTSEGPKFIDNPKFTLRDLAGIPGDVGQVAKDIAPFLAGGVATAPLKVGLASAVQGGIGLTTEALKEAEQAMKGKGFDLPNVISTGLFAAGGEAGGRALFSVGAKVFQRLFGSSADEAARMVNAEGKLTDEAFDRLAKSDVTPKGFNDVADQELTKAIDEKLLSPEEAKRFNFFKDQDLDPLKAQITRKADDFQSQVDLAEQTTKTRGRLEEQESIIADKFDDFAQAQAKFKTTSEVPAIDIVIGKSKTRKDAIASAYQLAREEAPKEAIINPSRIGDSLRKAMPSNRKTDGSVASIKGYLMENNIIDKNFKPVGKISVEAAEDARQFINKHYDAKNGFNNSVLRNLKDAIDDDVGSVVGKDGFKKARAAKIKFEDDLSKAGVSEFDTRKTNLVRDMLENKVNRDDVVKDIVLANKYRAEDLKQLVKYYKSGSTSEIIDGHAALGDLKKQTIERIKDAALKGPEGDTEGVKGLSRHGLDQILKKIGPKKLEILFPGAEGQFLRDMAKVARLREPTKGVTASPSRGAIQKLQTGVKKIPFIGEEFSKLIDVVKLSRADARAISNIQNTVKILEGQQATAAKQLLTPVGAPAMVAAGEEE